MWETVIGLEVHARLSTATKLFCGCTTGFGAPPNTNVCEVCLGYPGALPVLNRRAVELGLRSLVDLRAQEKARELRGKITWEGDLNAMRTDR